MDPQFSLYIYSKYSSNCKKLSTLINQSGLDFNLQMLCIDNDQVRQRIKNNKQLDIKSVPCILRFFPNGSVEKYEGSDAFNWVGTIVEQFKPPPEQMPPPRETFREAPREELREEPQEAPQYKNPSTQSKVRPQPQQREEPFPTREVEQPERPLPKTKKVPSRMKPIEQEEEATMIDDIPFEDDSDRHRSVEQPKRIMQADGKFLEDDELFGGDPVDYRREPAGAVKNHAKKNISDPNSVQARAKQMEQEYLQTQQELGNQSKRPMEARMP